MCSKVLRLLPLVCALQCVAGAAWAQASDAISTDRPDFVNSTDTVGRFRFQAETGFRAERNNGGDERSNSTPTLLRFGIAKDWELRLESELRITQRVVGATPVRTSGYGDTGVGVKWRAFDGKGFMPATAVLLGSTLESGTKPFRGNGARPSLAFAHSFALTDEISLGVMEGVVWDKTASGEKFTRSLFGISLGVAWNDRFSTFTEISSPQIARNKFGGTQASFDIGASFKATKDIQFDAALYKGMNKHTPDLAIGLGMSVRF